MDSDQGYRTLRPGPLCAESQMLQRKWDRPQNSVPQRDILGFTWSRSGLERVGGLAQPSPSSLGGAGAQFVQITDKPITWYQWQWLTPSSQAC